MTVLTLAGKPINWAKPPKPTARVLWSQKTTGGKAITGSLRTIAHLDHLNSLAIKRFDQGIIVFQGPYNTTVAASAGTHDFDACLDVYIPGVAWLTQQAFFRANGAGAYYRSRANGFSTEHIHYFTLPPREGTTVADDYKVAGFKVGKYVDGGYSTAGSKITSAQIEDYYGHRNALSGHAPDTTWFPDDIPKTIFNLNAYVAQQRKATAPTQGTLLVMTANIASKAKVRELLPVLRERKPHVVVITEAYNARLFLNDIEGYRNYQYPKGAMYGEEGPDIAVLVRRGVKVSRRRALKMKKRWDVPNGRKDREPRVYPSMSLTVSGFVWSLLGIHFPTVNNHAAQVESEDAVMAWLRAMPEPSVAAGDFNQEAEEIGTWIGPNVGLARGTKVDHALHARAEHVRTTRLRDEQPDGMHGWLLYKFTTKKKKG